MCVQTRVVSINCDVRQLHNVIWTYSWYTTTKMAFRSVQIAFSQRALHAAKLDVVESHSLLTACKMLCGRYYWQRAMCAVKNIIRNVQCTLRKSVHDTIRSLMCDADDIFRSVHLQAADDIISSVQHAADNCINSLLHAANTISTAHGTLSMSLSTAYTCTPLKELL